jgi:valyl-tRNA synthetase
LLINDLLHLSGLIRPERKGNPGKDMRDSFKQGSLLFDQKIMKTRSKSPNFNTNSWSYGLKIHIELKKLSNKPFVNNTPAAVVEKERQKLAGSKDLGPGGTVEGVGETESA